MLISREETERARGGEGIAFSSAIPLSFADTSDEDIEDIVSLVSDDFILQSSCVVLAHTIIDLIGGSSLQDSLSHSASYADCFSQLESIGDMTIEEIVAGKDAVETLRLSMWCVLNSASFKECITQAVALKDHDDVIPCIAGAVAGILYRHKNIPEEWLGSDIDTARIDSNLFNVNNFFRVPFLAQRSKREHKDYKREGCSAPCFD